MLGGALLSCKAKMNEISREARWAEVKGWYVRTGRPKLGDMNLTAEEEEVESGATLGLDSDEVLAEMAFTDSSVALVDPNWRPHNVPVVLNAGTAGVRRAMKGCFDWRSGLGGLGRSMLGCGVPWVECSDPKWCPGLDLGTPEGTRALVARLSEGLYGLVHLRPRVGSFSSARRPALRSFRYPEGVPWITEEKDLEEVARGLEEVMNVTRICRVAWSLAIPFLLVHPESSLIWSLEEVKLLWGLSGVVSVVTDQCPWGGSLKGTIQVLSTLSSFSSWGRRCSCAVTHSRAWGSGTGTKPSWPGPGEYSPGFCQALAVFLKRSCGWERPRKLEIRDCVPPPVPVPELDSDEEEGAPHPTTAKGPPVGSCWARRDRWTRVVVLRWRRREHVNLLELRMLIMGVRHASRCPGRRGRRLLMLTDSLVALGVWAKGRSTSWGLNQEVRRGCAHVLAWGSRSYVRYIHTSRNMADGPSRGRRIGVVKSGKDEWRRGPRGKRSGGRGPG